MKRFLKLFQVLMALSLAAGFLAACTGADNQLINDSPREYLLKPVDLPSNNFYIPENDSFSIPNEAAVGSLGKEKGEALVKEEERVTAWRVHYQADSQDQAGPLVYVVTITQHQSAKGAQVAVEKYNTAALNPDGGWTIEKSDIKLGDKTIVQTGVTEDQQGRKAINYRIEYAYRNMSVDVLVYGLEHQITLDMAQKAAHAVLLRLQGAPTSAAPLRTMTPTATK
jgi:hypothetical protein